MSAQDEITPLPAPREPALQNIRSPHSRKGDRKAASSCRTASCKQSMVCPDHTMKMDLSSEPHGAAGSTGPSPGATRCPDRQYRISEGTTAPETSRHLPCRRPAPVVRGRRTRNGNVTSLTHLSLEIPTC